MDPRKWIAAVVVARLLKRHPTTVRSWIKNGKVEGTRVGGGGGSQPGFYANRASLRAFLGADAAREYGI